MKQRALFLACLLVPTFAIASKPHYERSFEACEKLLTGVSQLQSIQAPTASTLIPLNMVLDARKSEYVSTLWRSAPMYAKQFPTEGLTYMYRTAESAADELIERLGVNAVTPITHARNPYEAADATLKLIDSKNPPAYIRKAVLIRDNVLIVVPILKLVTKKVGSTGKPLYIPIIAKGHQDLRQEDTLTAAFAAWALEPWIGQIPEKAELYLRPMVEKRSRKPSLSGHFDIAVHDYLPQVRDAYEDFMRVAEEASKADPETFDKSRPKRRWAECNRSPWAATCRERLNAVKDISMMPFLPTAAQTEALVRMGYGDLEKLSALDINSDEFIEAALRAEISPTRLRYFIAHALASTRGEPLVMEPLADFVKQSKAKYIVHVDFEDLLERNLYSGVYLFGLQIQPTSRPNAKPVAHKFIWAEKFDQPSLDDAWAAFLGFLKTEPRLQSTQYVISTYSKHELVKADQEFDILKQPASEFSRAERASPYYSVEPQEDAESAPIGRLIRRKEFFKNHPEIEPADVFGFVDRVYDLLDPVRQNLAFPGYTNSIKHVLDYVPQNGGGKPVAYTTGLNGLESMRWAKFFYATGDPETKKKTQVYNGMDVDANRAVSDYLRSRAGNPVDQKLRWKPAMEGLAEKIESAVKLKRKVSVLREKRELLARILGRDLLSLGKQRLNELSTILDRSEYLIKRQEDAALDEAEEGEVAATQQYDRYKFETQRQAALVEFFDAVKAPNTPDAIDAKATLFTRSSSYLTPLHLKQIMVLEKLGERMSHIRWKQPKSVQERLNMPELLARAFEKVQTELAESEDTIPSNLDALWQGLYYLHVFEGK